MENLVMDQLFGNIYHGKKVLITGNTGFKGSWLSLWLQMLGAEVIGYSMDIPTTPAHFQLLNLNIKTVFGNLLDSERLHTCIRDNKPDIVFHMAAQSLVRESYRNPQNTYATNVIGTLNVFEGVRKCEQVKAIINITTDKVYENMELPVAYKENDRLGGFDLYSSSKACAEILSASYRNSFFNLQEYNKTHQVLLATARAGNVIGGGDWASERLIPDVIAKSVKNESVVIRNLYAIRPWQHVLEPLYGYLLLGKQLLEGRIDFADAWNFGPHESQCVSVETLLNRMKQLWEKVNWEYIPTKEFHEAQLLQLNSNKANEQLQWRSVLNIDTTLEMTLNWYRNYYEHQLICSQQDIENYIKKINH